jgi:MFS transporter, ACS family, solute carrier family 17 (sodium-dependent inorganic phosphate cotransporter), other
VRVFACTLRAVFTAPRLTMNNSVPDTRPGRPRRHLVVGLTFLACVIAYTDRVNISVAAVAMKEHFGWTQTQKSWVLSAFYSGYLLFMLAGGVLATRYGGKIVLTLSVLAWSFFTLLTPAAAVASMPMLLLARVGMGVGEAAMFPAAYEMYGRWVPPGERARAAARLLGGIPIGTVIGFIGTGMLVARYGWASSFYVFGVAGIAWAILWWRVVHNDPATDPLVGPGERALLAAVQTAQQAKIPIRRVLLRVPVVAIVAAHVASTWGLYMLLSWLPSYFREVQGLSIANAGLYSAAPWLTMFLVGNAAGALSDRMILRGVSVTFTRKLMQCGGLLGSAVFLLLLREVHSASAAEVLLCAATGALGCNWSGFAPGFLDVAPRHGAVLYGLSNTFATIPGIVGVTITGWLVDVTGTYSAAFLLAATVSVVGALVFGLFFEARALS